jgi:phytoene synthase
MNLSPPILKSNLGVTLYLLPRARRKDAFLFYTFCHNLDHCVDDSFFSHTEKEKLLQTALEKIQETTIITELKKENLLIPLRFQEMISRRHLDRTVLCEIIRGMQMDFTINRYHTFEELRHYAWRVASAVGLISAELFGATGEAVAQYAEHLGMALQLTNILRDVAEDAARGRIYLPLEDLERFNVTEKEILQATPRPQAIHLFDYQAERALSFFAKATLAWKEIAPQERLLMRPARLMEAIYRELLQKMSADRYDLFHKCYRVGLFKKITLALHAMVSL